MRACHVLFARQLREVCVALPKERSPALALALKGQASALSHDPFQAPFKRAMADLTPARLPQ